MGRHHARTYANLPQARLVGVVDRDVDRAAEVADQYDCDAYPSADALLCAHPGVKAVTVAVPTVAHLAEATPLLERSIACLVEKPLAATLDEAKQLAQTAERTGSTLAVGHTERFNPAVRSVLKMDLNARFIEIQRVSPLTFRSLDVGVVMDLMIHDLDIVMALAQSDLIDVQAVGVAVVGKHEDVANARLTFANGCVASITASRMAMKTVRKLRLFSEQAYVSLDYQARQGMAIRKLGNQPVLDEVRDQLEAGADLTELDYTDLVNIEPLGMDASPQASDPLTAELTSFLAAVRGESPVEVSGRAGCAAVEAAQRVIEAIRSHQWEGVDPSKL
jgi:predicted dehydrogenase